MSADSENVPNNFADQLASFDDRLHATADDVDMLADIQNGIGRLLAASGSSEAEIRAILQERYDAGDLRKETFQLVKSLLDRYSTENIPTISTQDDDFSSTTVIPDNVVTRQPADGRVQVGSVLRDRFLLQEKISGGSMGVVYKAMDRRLAEAGANDHWVAIKVLSPQLAENGLALRALQQEAAKGRCLVHPNIVRFIDLDRDDELFFLVMEWLEGRTLADILDSKDASTIDIAAAFRIVRQIGDALDYAHRCGIVHADIKPGNIMVLPNGDAKLFDFGVARVRQQHAGEEFDPGVLGAVTPAYSSMQVLTGEEPVAADDVFSLGCLLYRLIAGYRVFGPRNAAEAAEQGMTPQRLKELNDSQWRALKRALSYSRVTRFDSLHDFIDALDADQDEPLRVEAPDHFSPMVDEERRRRWPLLLLFIAVLAAGVAYQTGYLQPLLDRFSSQPSTTLGEIADDAAASDRPDSMTASDEDDPGAVASSSDIPDPDRGVDASAFETEAPNTVARIDSTFPGNSRAVGPDAMLVDFSSLPAPTEVIPFTPGGGAGSPVNITVREDGPSVIIDFVRGSGLSVPMTLRLEEVGFSGNRSPWASGQYALSNSGQIHFPAGQARGRITLTVASDPLREADQQSTLRLRDADLVDSELAVINVSLEDDDQRNFEFRLPANTVAFAASQASIRESDPAVQIDLVRFNPDNSPLEVEFSVSDITATEGQDYFAPGSYSISFGPGQRSARLLVPLVQDAEVEGDEAFVIELDTNTGPVSADVYRRIVVMIRDDELQTR